MYIVDNDGEPPDKQSNAPKNVHCQGLQSSTHPASRMQYFPCTTCNLVFPSEEELGDHSRIHFKLPSAERLDESSSSGSGQKPAPYLWDQIDPKKQTSNPEDFSICCPICLINFISKEAYLDHQNICFSTFHHLQMNKSLSQNSQFHDLLLEGTSKIFFVAYINITILYKYSAGPCVEIIVEKSYYVLLVMNVTDCVNKTNLPVIKN